MKLLIVDPNKATTAYVSLYFRQRGYVTEKLSKPSRVTGKLADGARHDVLIIDPGPAIGSWVNLISSIQGEFPNLQIIFLTEFNDLGHWGEMLEMAGVACIISKKHGKTPLQDICEKIEAQIGPRISPMLTIQAAA